MDQIKTRFANFDELREYCYFSADPVGHLFLYVYGHDDEKLRELSDLTCTALQLANHWQDIARDLDQDRIYLPEETMIKHGYTYDDYHARVANERWRTLMKEEVDRAQEWFDAGAELWQHCDPRLAVDLMMFSWGGQAVLESIRKSNYNTWKKRPTVSKFKQLKLLFRAKRAWKAAHRKK
jgi:phytoene/squalene synthetase